MRKTKFFMLLMALVAFVGLCFIIPMIDEQPHQYLKMIAKNHGKPDICPCGCGTKFWQAKLAYEITEENRFIGYVIVYGVFSEKAQKERGDLSKEYILVERIEIKQDQNGEIVDLLAEQYVDFGPDSIFELASATAPPYGMMMPIDPTVANRYFKEKRYPEIKRFVREGWFHEGELIPKRKAKQSDV